MWISDIWPTPDLVNKFSICDDTELVDLISASLLSTSMTNIYIYIIHPLAVYLGFEPENLTKLVSCLLNSKYISVRNMVSAYLDHHLRIFVLQSAAYIYGLYYANKAARGGHLHLTDISNIPTRVFVCTLVSKSAPSNCLSSQTHCPVYISFPQT